MRVGERPALVVRRDRAGLFCGCKIHGTLDPHATLSGPRRSAPFFDLFYQVEGVKSGMHHPELLPLTEVFPKLLGRLGVRAQRAQRTAAVQATAPVPEISTDPRTDVVARTL